MEPGRRFLVASLPAHITPIDMLSISKKFLFIHIPKTAGNSIQSVLQDYSEDRLTTTKSFQDGVQRFDVQNERYRTRKHFTLRQYGRALGTDRLKELFVFSCVRNPYARAISLYFSPHRGVTAWNRAEFVKLVRRMPTMVSYLTPDVRIPVIDGLLGRKRAIDVDFLLHYETLSTDFEALKAKLDIETAPLPVRNRSGRGRQFAEYYDEELSALVARHFREDFERFEYPTALSEL